MPKQPLKKLKNTVILESTIHDGGKASGNLNHLSLEPASVWGQVEDAFFERGIAEENAAIEEYATLPAKDRKEPKRYLIRPTYLLWAGCGLTFLLALTLMSSRFFHQSEDIVIASAESPASTTLASVAANQEDPVLPSHAVLAFVADASVNDVATVDVAGAEAAPAEVPAAIAPIAELSATKTPVARVLAADPGEVAGDESGADVCRRGLEKKQSKVINDACIAALYKDSSLMTPLMKWTRGEFERGRTTVAFAWANRIVEIDPNQADAHLIIGMTQQTAQRFAEARIAYKRYLELVPKGGFSQDVRSALTMM
jgi:hypothetical protein